MGIKGKYLKARVVTKLEEARAPGDLSDSEDEKFDEGFCFAETAADYNFDAWKNLTQQLKKNKKTNLSETIKKVVAKKIEDEDTSTDIKASVKELAQLDEELREIRDTLKERQRLSKLNKKRDAKFQNEPSGVVTDDFHGSADVTFQAMDLSRPLLKALAAMNFVNPTPIQKAALPVALGGRDIYACAATGTGKTAAYMLPVLERLLYRPVVDAVTRVLVVVPTRELSVQVYQVSIQLAQFTNTHIALATGGLDLKHQECSLRRKPDIIIATPGRLIDHIQNTPSFSLHAIEVMILDEADKLLEDQFSEQLKEIIKQCAPDRQTMLFSATMNDRVRDLADLSLKRPVKLFLNNNTDVALNLRQEFIRIRPKREGDREAILCALVSRYFGEHTIVFVQTKKLAHRLRILLELIGVRVDELHSGLNQTQRIDALKRFSQQEVDVLVTTDLSARGLDIKDVRTVINYTLPATLRQYVHRVGRTARAGKVGRSVSMVGDQERKVLKEIVKKARSAVKQRLIEPQVITRFSEKIALMESDIANVLKEEQAEKEMQLMENNIEKAENKLKTLTELKGKAPAPGSALKRSWFQTPKERNEEKKKIRLGQHTKLDGKNVKIPNARISAEDRVQWELQKAADYQIRCAKRARKEKRVRAIDESDEDEGCKTNSRKKAKQGLSVSCKSSQSKELTLGNKPIKLRRLPLKEQILHGQAKKNGPGKGFKSKRRFKRR